MHATLFQHSETLELVADIPDLNCFGIGSVCAIHFSVGFIRFHLHLRVMILIFLGLIFPAGDWSEDNGLLIGKVFVFLRHVRLTRYSLNLKLQLLDIF